VSVAPPQQAWPLPPRAVGRTGDGAIPDLPAFLARIGLLGMGGARFPAALKARASAGVGTLVVNGCECEPGITVDQAVLLHESGLVEVGARALAGALGSRRIVIAVRQEPRLAAELKRLYPDFELLPCGREYPAGAEKLILRHLTGTLPPAGVLPYQLGYLIQNAVSLRTFGRAVQDAVPSVERPLTIAVPAQGFRRDVVAPIGMTAGELLGQFGILLGPGQVLVAGGLMMGVAADAQTPIHKGTTSLVVVPLAGLRGRERDCIRCGACFDACPLDLHPVLLTEALARPPFSAATRAQMAECFLCGCCDAVCPAGIPLAQRLREGKNACA
jgi:electron transport complex protein RnfC